VTEEGGKLYFARSDQPETRAEIQYAFGAKNVMTYVGEIGANRLTELHFSYRPKAKAWCITPGQERLVNVKLGDVNELGRGRKCVLCHAVKVKSDSAEPAPGFFGVGCESCHGPGGPHVAAAQGAGAKDLKMEKMSTWGAARLNAVCARCHRSAEDLSPGA